MLLLFVKALVYFENVYFCVVLKNFGSNLLRMLKLLEHLKNSFITIGDFWKVGSFKVIYSYFSIVWKNWNYW